jgi:anaerobic selenocysteine-containing dehydrogenase
VVVIDPIRTITAQSADWFIQPLPGTDVALMLAVMHVLIRDRLVDEDYVARHAEGFDQLAARAAEWPPARAAGVCGLDPGEIERFAQEYGRSSPTFIRTLIGPEHHETGAMFFRTLACLPVLTGAWRHRGGGLSRSVGVWAEQQVDGSVFEVPTATRTVSMNHLGRALTDPEVGIYGLFVWNGNPLVSVPNSAATRRGLEREDLFTVVSEQFVTDTASYADVLFPATTEVEHLDVIPSWGHLYLGWNQPAVAPVGEAVANTELWRRLAKAMGMSDPAFDLDDEALIRSALVGVDLDRLREQGWLRLDLPTDLRPYAEGGFATASGRAQLASVALAGKGQDPLPAFTPPGESRERNPSLGGRYPLVLLTPKNHVRFLNSSYSNHHGPMEEGPYLEIDPEDAESRGIEEGDLVVVENDRARLELPARISRRVRPGVVAAPWGWWGKEHNVNALTNDTLTDWGGGVAYFDTLVEVRRA